LTLRESFTDLVAVEGVVDEPLLVARADLVGLIVGLDVAMVTCCDFFLVIVLTGCVKFCSRS
jgi:hypothetical protein